MREIMKRPQHMTNAERDALPIWERSWGPAIIPYSKSDGVFQDDDIASYMDGKGRYWRIIPWVNSDTDELEWYRQELAVGKKWG